LSRNKCKAVPNASLLDLALNFALNFRSSSLRIGAIRYLLDVAPLRYSKSVPQPLETAMSTTTIRLPKDLKARVAAAAKRAGTTTHGFILDAIAEKAEQEDMRAAFDAEAEDRYARIVATGKTIPWQEMRGYLEDRLAGKEVKRPFARKLAR